MMVLSDIPWPSYLTSSPASRSASQMADPRGKQIITKKKKIRDRILSEQTFKKSVNTDGSQMTSILH